MTEWQQHKRRRKAGAVKMIREELERKKRLTRSQLNSFSQSGFLNPKKTIDSDIGSTDPIKTIQ